MAPFIIAEATVAKTTKGAVQYVEVKGDFEDGTINGFYLRKTAFKDLGRIPERVRVTIEEWED